MNLIYIGQTGGGTTGKLQRPVVIPVKNDTYIGLVNTAQDGRPQPLQFLAQLLDFPENTGIVVSYMTNNSTVELLTAANTAAQLEELDGICTMSHRLKALRTHLAGFLQRIVGLPVLLAGSLLHQHKRRILQTAHQIVAHSGEAPGGIIAGIIIPGYNIHFLGPLEVVQVLVGSHQIGGDGGIRIVLANYIALHFVIFQHAVGHEPAVIDGQTGESGTVAIFHTITQCIGQNDLIPIVNGMAPELQIPSLVDGLDGAIFLFQPNAECLLAVFTVALAAVLVADMPAGHVRIAAITLCQLFGHSLCVLLEDQGIGARIVALTEFMLTALVIDPSNFRILLVHPGRHCSGGGGQNNVVVFLAQHVYDFVQLVEVVFLLRGLDLGPGENIDGCAVDASILEVDHILIPDFLGPLIGIIVTTIENPAEGFIHVRSPHSIFVFGFHKYYTEISEKRKYII